MDFWTDRPTFVTGAAGFVGGWLVRRLVELGAEVTCLVRDHVPKAQLFEGRVTTPRGKRRLLDQVRIVHGDVRDGVLLERALGEGEIDTVFHLAAQAIVPIANRNAVSTFESNVAGTWTLLEATRRSPRVRQIVVASSDKAYGDGAVPYVEAQPLAALHPYDVSKACADLVAQSYASAFAVPVAITRCGNFFGGGDLSWSRIVPGTIRAVVRGERPVLRSDGGAIRDYFYVEDGVDAYLALAEGLAARPELAGEAFNFSYEAPVSALELVRRILALMGSSLDPDVRGDATHEIAEQWLSAAKARALLDWRPRRTLDDGLRRSIAWYRAALAGPERRHRGAPLRRFADSPSDVLAP